MTYAAQLAQNAVDLGKGVNFSPLEPLFTRSRIVMLGEQDHGDGASFAFKGRLIEYLHLTCGYNVLAFEADFYGLSRAWREAQGRADIRTKVASQVYYQWSQSKETAPLWRLIERRFETPRPLVVAGFDPRHGRHFSPSSILAELDQHLGGGLEHEDYGSFCALLVGLLEHEYAHKPSTAEQEVFFRVLKQLQQASEHAPQGGWPHELHNLVYTARNAWGLGGRDEGMTANLVWLAQRYPDEKIIVWAHNYHIAKDTALTVGDDACETFNDTLLGEGARKRLAGVCSLGIISAEGWYHPEAYLANVERREDLKTPPPASLEAHLRGAGLEHAFLDLHTLPTEPFIMGSVGHDDFSEKRWADLYDGVFFIRTMHGLS